VLPGWDGYLWVWAGARSPQGGTDLVTFVVFCMTDLTFPLSSLRTAQACSVPSADIE